MTGGAGFIGSHVVDALLAQGNGVTVIDDLSSGDRRARGAGGRLRVLDIVDLDALRGGLRGGAARAVFHLAAQASVVASVEDPGRDCEVNVRGTLNVVEAAGGRGAPVVFTSTGRRAVRRRGAACRPARTRIPAAALALRRLEVGGRGLRRDVVAARRHPQRRLPAGQRLRPAPEPARGGRRRRDLHRTTCTPAMRRSSTGTASRRATTSTSAMWSARCWRRGEGRHLQHRDRRGDRRDARSGASCSRLPASGARARARRPAPGRAAAQLPGRGPGRTRARLARAGADRRGPAKNLRGADRGIRAAG